MVSWWKAENNAGDAKLLNNGSLNNGAGFASGKVGQGFNFDGINDFVSIPDSPSISFTTSFSLEAWIFLRSYDGEFAPVISKWNDVTANNRAYSLTVYSVTKKLRFYTSPTGLSSPSVESDIDIPLNTFVHVAATWNSATNTAKVYVNGVERGSQIYNFSGVTDNNESLSIGKGDLGGNTTDFFNGIVDEASVYNRTLSAAEIAAIFNADSNGKCLTATNKLFDFDGDGRADQAVFRSGTWYLLRSTEGFASAQFGSSTDKITPADFDGDGKTDVAVFRDGAWYWLNSSNGIFNAAQFGQAGDIPVSADYTGDGRAELAVYRSGAWYTLDLSNNQFQAVQFGISSDKPVPADFDGDGKTDFAVYRDGNWYLLRSTAGFTAVQFGIASDKPTVGDFDGDSKADQAVYRGGNWYILGSTQGFSAVAFGIAGDVPVAADYDGDGKTDVAVFRNGNWYLLRSQQGFGAVQFGTTNDSPIPAAYVP
ncbi:MAG TPA: FG-GAP-like repeat-containing protein [Pyrinomonadaceae bacterium]|nr:FG-GAP-like repeat-containing protein [Pyrinomonadaceae bacterium]